jgi:putative addiction module component (TIGR02574 family)
MKQDPTNLLKEALKLPPEGRAALAAALLDSLDHEVDQDSEAAWEAEIDRRLRDLDSRYGRFRGPKPVLKSSAANGAGGRSSPRSCPGSAGGVQVVSRPE